MTAAAGGARWQRTLWIMFAARLISAVGFAVIFPFLPLYVAELGTRTSLSIEFWAGMVFSRQALTMALASPIWGSLADRLATGASWWRAARPRPCSTCPRPAGAAVAAALGQRGLFLATALGYAVVAALAAARLPEPAPAPARRPT